MTVSLYRQPIFRYRRSRTKFIIPKSGETIMPEETGHPEPYCDLLSRIRAARETELICRRRSSPAPNGCGNRQNHQCPLSGHCRKPNVSRPSGSERSPADPHSPPAPVPPNHPNFGASRKWPSWSRSLILLVYGIVNQRSDNCNQSNASLGSKIHQFSGFECSIDGTSQRKQIVFPLRCVIESRTL